MVQDNFYTATVYNKGAEVIRMYHTLLLGEKLFRKATDLYFERHDGDAVTCDDFRKAMSDTLSGAGKTNLLISLMLNLSNGIYRMVPLHCLLNVSIVVAQISRFFFANHVPPSQLQPTKLPFVIPIKFGVMDPDTGKDLPIVVSEENSSDLLHGDTFVMTKESESLILHNVPNNAKLSFLRSLSAL